MKKIMAVFVCLLLVMCSIAVAEENELPKMDFYDLSWDMSKEEAFSLLAAHGFTQKDTPGRWADILGYYNCPYYGAEFYGSKAYQFGLKYSSENGVLEEIWINYGASQAKPCSAKATLEFLQSVYGTDYHTGYETYSDGSKDMCFFWHLADAELVLIYYAEDSFGVYYSPSLTEEFTIVD